MKAGIYWRSDAELVVFLKTILDRLNKQQRDKWRKKKEITTKISSAIFQVPFGNNFKNNVL